MISPFSAGFTLDFYLWEIRGRGWDLSDSEVELEPPFETFHYSPDAILSSLSDPKDVFLSSLVEGFLDGLKSPERVPFKSVFDSDSGTAIDTIEDAQDSKPIILPFKVSPDEMIEVDQLEQFLISLSYSKRPVGFELIGSADSINMQFACFRPDARNIRQQIQIFFPSVSLAEESDRLLSLWKKESPRAMIDFGLEEEFMRPLQVFSSFDPDPLTGVVGAIEGLEEKEIGGLQILFHATRRPWADSILRSVSDTRGKSLFLDAPEMVKLSREKLEHPLFACVTRVFAQGSSHERAQEIAQNISSALRTTKRPESNALIPLSNGDYPASAHEKDILQRTSRRTGMIVNAMELATLVHPPSPSIQSEKLHYGHRKTKAAPREVKGQYLILGENRHHNIRTTVTLGLDQRLRHMHIIGATGTGKSTLLQNLIRQDIEHGEGVAVLDPHGDLIERLLEQIPEERYGDVIVFDPADTQSPVGFNILRARSETEKNIISSDLVAIFRRFSTSWGDQMTTVLGNSLLALLESSRIMTLVDLRRFLADAQFRKTILGGVADTHIKYFWEKEFPMLRGNSQSSILTRLDSFLRPKLVRNIIGQEEGLDFADIIVSRKILLIKLAQGIIGEENAHLMGSLIVSKLHQVVMERQVQRENEREPFFLYLDEFQNFITPTMSAILSGARKYKLGLVLAHQDLRQLWDYDTALANSVISNAATRVCFRLGDFDADKLHSGFSHFDSTDLQNLGVGEAIVRVDRKDHDFNLRTFEAPQMPADVAQLKREAILSLSRGKYGRPIVEDKVLPSEPPPVKQEVRSSLPQPKEPVQVKPVTGGEKRNVFVTPPVSSSPRQDLSRHRYLQTLIKKMAEQRDYRAVIEEPTDDGGRVDVGLKRDERRIAVEISVTTGDVQEVHNIEKCLKAGYEPVIVCSQEKKNLEAIRKLMTEKLPPADQTKVLLFEPEELFFFLDQEGAKEATREERVKGYRVKVNYKAVSESDKKEKRDAVAQVIVQAMRRIKGSS